MYPAPFEYHAPLSVAEALALLHAYGDGARFIAGGHSLVPTMKLRLAQPEHLIDVSGIAQLRGMTARGGVLDIGSFTTHWEVESSPVVRSVMPYLSSVASRIADPQVRNRGTIGGSLVHADPAADYPASLLALDGELVCYSEEGERVVPASDWFTGMMSTALGTNELLGRVRFAIPKEDCVATYLKLPNPASRFAVVGVAANMRFSSDGTIVLPRVAITGVGEVAFRAHGTEALLTNARLDDGVIEAAADQATHDVEISSDLFFSVEDKRQLCRAYVKRALIDIRQRRGAMVHQ